MLALPEERQGSEGLKKVHLIGIGGVGMAGLAILLQSRGHSVSGCDLYRTARTRWLEANGIPVASGHDPAHLEGVDEVIVTPAVAKENGEYQEAVAKGLPIRRRGEVLAEIVNGAADSIVVCGSHGKTTTATFIAKLLLALGERVSWAIGGETAEFPVAGVDQQSTAIDGNRLQSVLIVEGDESDGTLALYHAKTLVVTNVEYDHPDHFPTVADYEAIFNLARSQAQSVVEGCADNADTAVRVALARGHSQTAIDRVLSQVTATLPDRRFQKLGEGVWADYAHHPSEIRYTLNRARKQCAGRLRVLFQPHRYSRTKALKDDFAAALGLADEVILCPTYSAFEKPMEGGDVADLYAKCRETFAKEDASRVKLARTCEEAWEHAANVRTEGDMTLLLGAGDIINLKDLVVVDQPVGGDPRAPRNAALTNSKRTTASSVGGDPRAPRNAALTNSKRTTASSVGGDPRAPRVPALTKIFIGAGTNTLKSDLHLNVTYVKTTGPAGAIGATHPLLRSHFPYMAGIPGTLGGWIKMNAGAFGHSISEVIDSVKVDGRWLAAADCGFGYRESKIAGEIQDVRFKREPREGLDTPESYLARRAKFPPGTYGSFFKNPPGDFAGRLLEEAGAKTLRVGGAYVWERHANVIVRGEGATASDVLALAKLMRNAVIFKFGIKLSPEVAIKI